MADVTPVFPGTGRLFLGLGLSPGASPEDALELVERVLAVAGGTHQDIALVASIDIRRNEPAAHAVAAHFGVALQFFDAPRLEQETPRLQNPSERVFAAIGCHGVAEAAALAAAGSRAVLLVPKTKLRRVTAALAIVRQDS